MSGVPPILQVLALGALSAYVLVTLTGRMAPAIGRRIFAPGVDFRAVDHIIEYTVVPALVLAGAVAVVVTSWDASRSWFGDWAPWRVAVAAGLVAYAFAAVMAGTALSRRMDLSDATRMLSWVPLLLLVTGIGAVIGAVFVVP